MATKICEHCNKENPSNYKYCAECGFELPKSPEIQAVEPATTKRRPELKNRLIFAISFSVAFAILFFVGQHLTSQFFSIDKNMLAIASSINESCPIMVDSETRLDNTIALKNKIFNYYYTLINIDRNEVNPAQIKETIEPKIVNSISTNPELKPMRALNVTFKYNYKDKNGVFLFDIAVGPDQYQ